MAQRAVQLMLRTDLVNACASRLASVLKHNKMKEAADLIMTVWHSYASISKDWEGLLQDQEEALESTHEDREAAAAAEVQALRAELSEARARADEEARAAVAREREVESLRQQLEEARGHAAGGGPGAAAGSRPASARPASASARPSAGGGRGYASAHAAGGPRRAAPAPAPAPAVDKPASGAAPPPASRRPKELSRANVLEVIAQIYKSKERSDELFREGKQERETMEEHLYRFMNTKFGLRSLIIENVEALLAGIAKHKDTSVEVALFSKILGNQVEEEVRVEMDSLRKSVAEVLKQVLQMKFPQASSFQR